MGVVLMKTQKNEKKSLIFLAAVLCGLFAVSSYAREGLNIDALVGVDLISGGVNSSSSTTSLGFGGRIGYHLTPNWEIGGSFTTTSNSVNVGPAVNTSSTSLLLGDLNYHLPDRWEPLYFGVRLGVGYNSGTSNSPLIGNYSTNNLAYGFLGGYDFYVSSNFTIGPRISYTMVSQNPGTLGDFQAHAAFKYFL
jgi:Outer membrane protein beta-barrel domain